jgi:surface polysaccharide O-acyltransferase-like enzyme
MKKDKYIFSLDVIRTLAISGVVAIHVALAVSARADFFGGISWYISIIINSISRSAIPLFILLSGYLILSKNESFKKTMFRILSRISIPLIFWTYFYTWWIYKDLPSLFTSLTSLPMRLLTVNVFHLYYLAIIIGLYAISPFLRNYLQDKTKKFQLSLTGLLLCVTAGIVFLQYILAACSFTNISIMWIPYVGLYLAGYTLGHHTLSIKPYILYGIFILSFVTTTALNIYYYSELFIQNNKILNPEGCISHYTDYYLSLNIILMAIPLFLLLLNANYSYIQKTFVAKIIKSIARMSFGIFLTHLFILQYFDTLALFDWITPLWLYIIVKWTGVFLTSYILTFILMKIPVIRKIVGEK